MRVFPEIKFLKKEKIREQRFLDFTNMIWNSLKSRRTLGKKKDWAERITKMCVFYLNWFKMYISLQPVTLQRDSFIYLELLRAALTGCVNSDFLVNAFKNIHIHDDWLQFVMCTLYLKFYLLKLFHKSKYCVIMDNLKFSINTGTFSLRLAFLEHKVLASMLLPA